MTAKLRNIWSTINKVLTITNLILLAVLTFSFTDYKEIKDKKIPVAVNILLLIFLGLGVYAAIYNLI
ncbi:hypothetical protein [uncultured Pontibacter sp.]|uniref:hypothetical protein n=1 Tax=uncultured Pontibacter sp. TaxID=453356 RepID=UPI00260D53A3|nr:hypothetical protein [uncultured Pontibacter sp.]